jgi:hypothetical protein
MACRAVAALASGLPGVVSLMGEVAVMPMSDSDPKDRPPEGRSATDGADAARAGETTRVYWENGRLVSRSAARESSHPSRRPPAGRMEDSDQVVNADSDSELDERSAAGIASTDPKSITPQSSPDVLFPDLGPPPCPPYSGSSLPPSPPSEANRAHGPRRPSPGWYADPWHEADRRSWDGSVWSFEAGWYPDSGQAEGRRYWTGSQWSEHRTALGGVTTHTIPASVVATYGVRSGTDGASAGWYPDPDYSDQPLRLRYWDGHGWTGRRRTDPPDTVRWLAPIFFTLLGIATGMTAWPANGASCHLHPPPRLPIQPDPVHVARGNRPGGSTHRHLVGQMEADR